MRFVQLFSTALVGLSLFVLGMGASTSAVPAVEWATRDSMPTGREGPFVAALGDKIYVAGGGPGVCTFTDVLEVYDQPSDSWQTIPASGTWFTARSNGDAAAVNGKIYAMGGSNACGVVAITANEEYDPITGTWAVKSPMPVPRVHQATVAHDGLIYVFGGTDGAGSELSSVDVYDPVSDTWDVTPPPAMPAPAGVARAALIGTTIYVHNGYTGAMHAFDTVSETWISPDPSAAPDSQSRALMVGLDGMIYVIGGVQSGVILDDVRMFDPASDQWQLISPSGTWFTGRHALGGAVVNGKIYAIGGDETFSPPYSTLNEEATVSVPPGPVGGIVELATHGDVPAESSGSSASDYTLPIAAVAAAAVIAVAAGGWYARRHLS